MRLLLLAKVPVHVVGERLGHKNMSMTLEIYAHVLLDMQEDAAATLESHSALKKFVSHPLALLPRTTRKASICWSSDEWCGSDLNPDGIATASPSSKVRR